MSEPLQSLSLRGLRAAPSQVWGSVRLVPLVDDNSAERPGDLRLAQRVYPGGLHGAAIKGHVDAPGLRYYSWIPHGFVFDWSRDGSEVSRGAHLEAGRGRRDDRQALKSRLAHRLVRSEGPRRIRLLPMHLAMEGLLGLYFKGPEIAWQGYSHAVLAAGLSPRVEWSLSGQGVPDLSDALGLFEIAEGQRGVLIFVGDQLGAAFVAPHPEDYRALHAPLLQDLYGQMLAWYGQFSSPPEFKVRLDASRVSDLSSLREELDRQARAWEGLRGDMAGGLFHRPINSEQVRRCGPFTLHRFITTLEELAPEEREHHVGEVMLREDGAVEYLKTYRLSRGQLRRVRLLRHLSRHQWHLVDAFKSWTGGGRFDTQLRRAGLGFLISARAALKLRKL